MMQIRDLWRKLRGTDHWEPPEEALQIARQSDADAARVRQLKAERDAMQAARWRPGSYPNGGR